MEQTEFGSFIDCNQRGDCCHFMWRSHNRGIVYRWGWGLDWKMVGSVLHLGTRVCVP